MNNQIRNAVIKTASFDTECGLTAWLHLDYGGGVGQAFGGYQLYSARGWENREGANVCGHFIARVLEIAGVTDWADLPGRVIRAECSDVKIEGIGHAINNEWFFPKVELENYNRGARHDPQKA